MPVFEKLAGAICEYFAGPSIRRAAEWERIEEELTTVTGSREKALVAAQMAVECAKLGFESPEQLARMARDALAGNMLYANHLRGITRQLDRIADEARQAFNELLDAVPEMSP